jgi:hypothetical protein
LDRKDKVGTVNSETGASLKPPFTIAAVLASAQSSIAVSPPALNALARSTIVMNSFR